jgi:glutathione S-transferase
MHSRPTVRLYGRPDCHLCDEARAELRALLAEGLSFELLEIDIEEDDALLRSYLELIPVIELDGEVISELGLDADGLRARLGTVSA